MQSVDELVDELDELDQFNAHLKKRKNHKLIISGF